MTTRKKSGDEPTAEQLPAEAPDENPKPVDDPAPNQDLPEEQPPRGEGENRGRDEEARAAAPGQQRKDPNSYPDPENPPHTP